MKDFLYIAACVIVPLAWGLLVVAVSNRIDRWAKARHQKTVHVDYHI